ncbi:membrane-anchored junction protein isoform X2 [Scophthalmus maximus]|uniref:membrane-anchored junction protein isoform X2 n=1 Tax=Scophthalmus maximus TaxID=52904 RepID=UPI001FA8C199|nr:membrane-anchored junction protein isoform X2 [Scophthalmus maximus]
MTLQTFSFPFPETRFVKADCVIYKFKIRGGSSFSVYISGEEVMGGNCFNQELEDIIRTVLGNLDSLQPFSSTHFNVFPYKRRWEGLSKVMCKHEEKKLRAYPFILILYVEKNKQSVQRKRRSGGFVQVPNDVSHVSGKQVEKNLRPEEEKERHSSVSEPRSKRCRADSPPEEAILLDLIKDVEADGNISMSGLHVDNPHAEGEVEEDPGPVDEMKSDVNMMNESPGEVRLGEIQDMGVEEEEKAASGRSGILTRLASHIFPFSLFFRDH